jgi:hypothetical protein
MAFLSGAEAKQVGFTVKSRLRDYIAANLDAAWGAVDVRLVQQLEEEVPTAGPLVSIRTVERERIDRVDEWQHSFTCEARVMADTGTGGLMIDEDAPALSEAISDDLDDILTRDGSEEALLDLGIDNLMIGRRREVSERGLHTNRHAITFDVYAVK